MIDSSVVFIIGHLTKYPDLFVDTNAMEGGVP